MRKQKEIVKKMVQRRQEMRQVRKKNNYDFFTFFSARFRDWLKELVARYKESGDMPLLPTYIADYYTDKHDKEIALFSTLLMSFNSSHVIEQVDDMRRIITDHPWEWLINREYISISLGGTQKESLKGNPYCKYWMIAGLMAFLYESMSADDHIRGVRFPSYDCLEPYYKEDWFEMMRRNSFGLLISQYDTRLLSLCLASCGGIGNDLWDDSLFEDRCPLNGNIMGFIKVWFPDYNTSLPDEAIHYFTLDKDSDFFYAYYAYKKLQSLHPRECALLSSRYNLWYSKGSAKANWEWKQTLPKIDF